jgi:Ca2+-binding EF-hand superfamily protein
MAKEDPLHRLSRTTTTAFRNQQFSVWKEAEKDRVQEIPQWGTPSKATPSKTSSSPLPRCATLAPNPSRALPSRQPMTSPTASSASVSSAKKASITSPGKNSKFQNTFTPTKPKPSFTPTSASSASRINATASSRTPRIPTVIMTSTPSDSVAIVSSTIELPNKEKALELFDQLDENASGKMSLAELDKGIVMLYPDLNNKPAIMRAFKATDGSGNGFIDREEFPFCLSYIVYYNNLWSLFKAIDEDGDRRITKQEFLKVSNKLDLPRDADQVFSEIDVNGGGMILFDEFCHWLAQNKADLGADDKNVNDLKKRLQDLEARKRSVDKRSKDADKDSEPELVPEGLQNVKMPPEPEVMQLFDRLDENASGKLSLAELDKGIVMSYPELNNKPAIMAAYKAADRNGDGFVLKSEFGFFMRYAVYYNNLWHMFESLDSDGDRRISKEEFVKAADKLDLGSDAEEIFAEMDVNDGGMVLFGEMIKWFAENKSNSTGATDDQVF